MPQVIYPGFSHMPFARPPYGLMHTQSLFPLPGALPSQALRPSGEAPQGFQNPQHPPHAVPSVPKSPQSERTTPQPPSSSRGRSTPGSQPNLPKPPSTPQSPRVPSSPTGQGALPPSQTLVFGSRTPEPRPRQISTNPRPVMLPSELSMDLVDQHFRKSGD